MERLTKSYILNLEEKSGLRRNDLRRQFNKQVLDSQQPLKGGKDRKSPKYLVLIETPATTQEEQFLQDSREGDYPDSYYQRYFELRTILQKFEAEKEFVSTHCHNGFFEDHSSPCEDDDEFQDEITPYFHEKCQEWLDRINKLSLNESHRETLIECAKTFMREENKEVDVHASFKTLAAQLRKIHEYATGKLEGKEDGEKSQEGTSKGKEVKQWECAALFGKILRGIKGKSKKEKEDVKTVGVQIKDSYGGFQITLKAKNFVGKLVHLRNFIGSKFLRTGSYTLGRGGEKEKWEEYGNGYLFKEVLHDFIDKYNLDIKIKYKRNGEAHASVRVNLIKPDNETPDQECKVNVTNGPYH